jgi:hypothetical protein
MSLLGRNVTGDDTLALWKHIARCGPIERSVLLQRYYPGDANDPNQSDSRKTLEDAIDFLEESNQVVQKQDGYIIKDKHLEAVSPRVALLKGLRAQTGEDAAYLGILDTLTEEDERYFDTKNQLEDLLSTKWSSISWTKNKINYWARTMSMLGVISPVNSDSDENYTHLLSISQSLLLNLLKDSFAPNTPIKIESMMKKIEKTYLPVYATTNRNTMAQYFEQALKQAELNNSIELDQASDFGGVVEINGQKYNELTLRVSDN